MIKIIKNKIKIISVISAAIIVFIYLLIFLFNKHQYRKNIMNPDKFSKIIADLHIISAAKQAFNGSESEKLNFFNNAFTSILHKYNVSIDNILFNIKHYTENANAFYSIYSKAIDKLSYEKSIIKNE